MSHTDPPEETLSTDDLNAEIDNYPPGAFLALPDLTSAGVVNLNRAVQNYREGAERARAAMAQGFFLEVIELRVQHTEFWLRVLLVHARGVGSVISPDERLTFGGLILKCALHLPNALFDRLQNFNRVRIGAVHHYLLGATDYNALGKACEDFIGIDSMTFNHVVEVVGKPVSSAKGRPGEVIVRRAP